MYGGRGRVASKFDEPGYIAVPPCLWGYGDEQGLEDPLLVSNRVLHAVKTANSTYGHHGEMAWLQMLYIKTDSTAPAAQAAAPAAAAWIVQRLVEWAGGFLRLLPI